MVSVVMLIVVAPCGASNDVRGRNHSKMFLKLMNGDSKL
jgi:hypothetical protein